ncbi:universal stress protein [Leifsonia sp. 22587]|uniref:universal stress protein n=1 Tax=Leifsonia sp. 22587 TaxID=3453946 RepID=UPI003F844650
MAETIVVAVDGEPAHRAALDWAAARAERTGRRLHLIHVVEPSWGDRGGEPDPSLLRVSGELLAAEKDYALAGAGALARAAAATPLEIGTESRYGHLAAELAAASADAAMLVIGTPPEAERRHAFASSSAARVAAAARCSVAAVPHGWGTEGRGVVVGVDGELTEDPAVEFAAVEAEALGEPLTIACAGFLYHPLLDERVVDGTEDDPREQVVEDAADTVLAGHPAVTVFTEVLETSPARGLVAEADGSRMLVLGSNDWQGVERAVLGSVAHDVLVNLRTPVVVVRAG